MSLDRTPSALPGVRYGALACHSDARGSFRELWREDSTARYVQANLSTSVAGVLRGLHLHRRQLDYWVVMSGRAFVALVDVRRLLEGSAGEAGEAGVTGEAGGVVETRELRSDEWVVIPAGVAHGFLALEPLQLLYLVTNQYDGSDEFGFAWDDPAVGVPWPPVAGASLDGPIVSDRDASNPALSDLVARLRADRR